MIRQRLSRLVGAGLGVAFLLAATAPGRACATFAEGPYIPQTYVEAERAVIIWDSAHQTEHFIRQANIHTQSPDLGFLVPTPQTPELAEVNPQIFDLVNQTTNLTRIPPVAYITAFDYWAQILSGFRTEDRTIYRYVPTYLSDPTDAKSPHTSHPMVVAEQDVAGYRATILSADDPAAIDDWLSSHGYTATPQFNDWLKPYIAAKWKITAFELKKVTDPDGDSGVLATRAIRLTFPTHTPFYPYSEPSDRQLEASANPYGRALHVAVLSDSRVTGALADHNAWPGKLEYAGTSRPPGERQIPNKWLTYANLSGTGHDKPVPTTLSSFLDESNPRPGTADLYFTADTDNSAFRSTSVDYTKPAIFHTSAGGLFGYCTAVLFAIVLPVAPIYCGSRVYAKCRRVMLGLNRPGGSSRLLLDVIDRVMGTCAIFLGAFAALTFGARVATFFDQDLHDLIFADIVGDISTLILALIIIAATTLVCWAVISCGVFLWRKTADATTPPDQVVHMIMESRWRVLLGACSIFAGGLGIFGTLSVLFTLPPIL